MKCEVIASGRLQPFTAVEAPGVTINCPAITDKDKEDIKLLMELEPPIDYLAVSFLQTADDVEAVLEVLDELGIPDDRWPKIVPRQRRMPLMLHAPGVN